MSNVPVIESVRAALAFQRLHWREAGGVLAFAAATSTVETAAKIAGDPRLGQVANLAGVIAFCMAYAGLMRRAFADEHPGDPEYDLKPGGFQWSLPEWRLLGVFMVVLFTCLIVWVLAAFVGALFVVATGLVAKVDPQASLRTILAAMSPREQAVFYLVLAATLLGPLYTFVRLALAPAATIAGKRVTVFPTWKLTHGQTLRILAALILAYVPTIAVGLVLGIVLQLLGVTPGPGGVPQASLPIAVATGAVSGLVWGFVQLPIFVGLTAYLYRGLRPAGEK